jgi:ABC-2 type transport system permease protein
MPADRPVRHRSSWFTDALGDVGLVARREISERLRGRILKVGTLVILAVVAGGILIPKLHGSSATPPQRVGIVGASSDELTKIVEFAGQESDTPVRLEAQPNLATAKRSLRDGNLDVVVVDGNRIVVNTPVGGNNTSDTASLVQALAPTLGVLDAYHDAGLTEAQILQVSHAKEAPIESLSAGTRAKQVNAVSIIGLILLFTMLTQYTTWILMGVMQEKASRVVEVLLATVRPIQLLGGKVLGIGLVAMGQATLIVVFALSLSAAVGSDLLKGTNTLVLASTLLWLVLGYAFYCWVYAAAGSLAERQDQVQTLAFPLSLPMIVGYVTSIIAASSASGPSIYIRVFAFFPPTAPFAMPVLVGLHAVTWWAFMVSVALTLVATFFTARVAATVYRRAVLRSGGQVRLRELLGGAQKTSPARATS